MNTQTIKIIGEHVFYFINCLCVCVYVCLCVCVCLLISEKVEGILSPEMRVTGGG